MSNWETQVIISMKVTDFDLWFNVHLSKWKLADCNLLCGNMRNLWNLLVTAPGGIMSAYFPSSKTLHWRPINQLAFLENIWFPSQGPCLHLGWRQGHCEQVQDRSGSLYNSVPRWDTSSKKLGPIKWRARLTLICNMCKKAVFCDFLKTVKRNTLYIN